jgi:hypothetical protein
MMPLRCILIAFLLAGCVTRGEEPQPGSNHVTSVVPSACAASGVMRGTMTRTIAQDGTLTYVFREECASPLQKVEE